MGRFEHTSRSAADTIAFGKRFAEEQLTIGAVIVLRGELGAGKTHFTKGIAQAFGIDDHDLSSPTFSLANEYEGRLPDGTPLLFYHLDCYRFEKPEELLELGVEEYLYPRSGICIIEWPERIEEYLPQNKIEVLFEVVSNAERKITINT
jgi:tRNA threonylcarbamoyladenosine biosynthesis protein TsaE